MADQLIHGLTPEEMAEFKRLSGQLFCESSADDLARYGELRSRLRMIENVDGEE